HLADGFEERQRLDVAHGAAYLDYGNVGRVLLGGGAYGPLYLVRDVRDDLNGLAEVVAAPLLLDDGKIDAPRRPVVRARQARVREALVVAEVEVCLRAVVGDEDLAVLEGRHRAGVNVYVRVELDACDA